MNKIEQLRDAIRVHDAACSRGEAQFQYCKKAFADMKRLMRELDINYTALNLSLLGSTRYVHISEQVQEFIGNRTGSDRRSAIRQYGIVEAVALEMPGLTQY